MIIPRTPYGIAHAFFRHRRKMLGVFAATVGGCLAYVLLATPVYQASASVAVDFGANSGVKIGDQPEDPVGLAELRRSTVANYESVLYSRDLLIDVIQHVGVDRLFPDLDDRAPTGAVFGMISTAAAPEPIAGAPADAAAPAPAPLPTVGGQRLMKAVRAFRDDFTVDGALDSTVIELNFFHEDPVVATETLDYLIRRFIERRADLFENPHLAFLERQIVEVETAMKDAQTALFEYRQANGIFLPERQLERLMTQRESIQSDIDALGYEDLTRGRVTDEMKAKAETRIGFLQAQIGRVDAQIGALERHALRHQQLDQEQQSKTRVYETVLDRLEQARFADRVNAGSISPVMVLDRPKTGDKPARPQKLLLMLSSTLLGGFAALLTALIAETFRSRFSSPDQVIAELDLPALAVIEADAPNLLEMLERSRKEKRA